MTGELQAFIDGVPDGACIRFAAGTSYRADDTLRVANRHDLTLYGNGARLFTNVLDPILQEGRNAGFSDRRQLIIEGGSNIRVEGLTIDGPNVSPVYVPQREFEHGILISGTQGVVLRDLVIKEVFGEFVMIDDLTLVPGSGIRVPARDVLVEGGDFDVAGRSGLSITGSAERVTFTGNHLNRIARSGIDIELIPNRFARDIRITDNVLEHFGLNWLAIGGASPITNLYAGFNRVVNDTIQLKVGSTGGVVNSWLTFDGNRSNIQAEGVIIFSFRDVRHVSIVGNTQHFVPASGQGGVLSFENSCGITLSDNDFAGAMTAWSMESAPPCLPLN